MSERGRADHNLRFSHEPFDAARRPRNPRPTTRERVDGLTKHTKRFVAFLLVGLLVAFAADAIRGSVRLLAEWPSLMSVAVAIVWMMAASDDFRMGTHKRIPRRVEGEGARHPIGWYRTFLARIVLPNAALFGWLIPGSMFPVAVAYLSGILVQPAAIGALFLLGNMYLFLNLRYPRDDFLMLAATQIVILFTNPGGVPAVLRALGSL